MPNICTYRVPHCARVNVCAAHFDVCADSCTCGDYVWTDGMGYVWSPFAFEPTCPIHGTEWL